MNRCLLMVTLAAVATGAANLAAAPSPAQIDWRMSGTDHFDITYTPGLELQIDRIGRQAERAYQQVSADLSHDLSLRPLLVLYPTRDDLARAVATRTIPGNREHILVPLDVPAPAAGGELVHELTHSFAFDLVPSLRRGEGPRWIHEGLAEIERGDWDASDVNALRSMLQAGTVPRVSELRGDTLAGAPRIHHIVGHAAFDFLVSRAGRTTLKRFLVALRETPTMNAADVYFGSFAGAVNDFDREFREYLTMRFAAQR